MRRLAHIGPARLDAVVGPWRNVEFLFRIAIEVADQDALCAVLVVIPALERRRHTRAALADGLRQRQRARRLADSLLSGAGQRGAGGTRHHQPERCDSIHLRPLLTKITEGTVYAVSSVSSVPFTPGGRQS